jgi:HK97 family phage portal protein
VIRFLRNVRAGYRFAREVRSGATSDLVNPSAWLLNALGLGVAKSGATISENAAFNVSCVRRCVDLRAMLIAKLPVKVFRKTARGPEEQRDHPLARLLRTRVSAARTSYKWRYVSQVCFDLGGNAYSRLVRDSFEDLQAIVWTKPSEIRPLYNETTDAVAFEHRGRRLAQHDILHLANLSTNGVTGRSPLADLRESIGLALTAEEAAARSFSNGNRKPGVLVGGQNMTQAKAQEFVQFWMQNYAGTANTGKTPLIFGGVEWREAGMSNHDAELLLTRRFSVEEICRVYHIPLLLGGDANSASAWGSAVEKIMRGLVEFTLDSLCVNWESEMNTTLLTEREQEEGYYVKFMLDALLRGSFADRARIYQTMRGIAAMDVNQIRELEEWPLYPDSWAGDPRLPMNNQGGQAAPATAAETTSQS